MKHGIKKGIALLVMLCVILAGWFADIPGISGEDAAAAVRMQVHFLDVGQGNSVLVKQGSHFMLYDGGDAKASSKVVSYLKKQGVKKLDYVVVSHYDADHLNGVIGALHVFGVKKVLAPDYTTDSAVYRSFRTVMKQKGLTSVHPRVGKKYRLGKASFTILAPGSKSYTDENNYSIAMRLVCGSASFMMTGDAEAQSEYEMMESGQKLRSDVYLCGHHGSSSSSTQGFLKAVRPKYAVISCGKGNSYGHPTAQTMSRLKSLGCNVYRTDEQGDIVASSDGRTIRFNHKPSTTWADGSGHKATPAPDQGSPSGAVETSYIGNKNSRVFHRPSCRNLPFKKNQVIFKTRDAAVNAGYRACGNCNP